MPYVQTKNRSKNYLIISDTQIPFEAKGALEFCKNIKKEFKIPNSHVYHVVDEVDHYWGSSYPKYVMADHTAMQEIQDTIEIMHEWYAAFPVMKLCTSNHGERWMKKALEAEIPSIMIRRYKDVMEAPDAWQWKDKWLVKDKHPFCIQHGVGYSGANGHRNAAIDNGMSTVIGHLHSHQGIARVKTEALDIWGMNVGSLIDQKAYAFHYSKHTRHKAVNGVGVVLDHGKIPIWIPYE